MPFQPLNSPLPLAISRVFRLPICNFPKVRELCRAARRRTSYDQEVVLASGDGVSLNDGTMGTRRSVVSGLGDSSTSNSISSVTENFFSSTTIENQALTGFENDYLGGGTGKHNIGSATTLDLGFDPATGISWGRWSTGTASFVDSSNGNTTSIDLTGRSLHWISGPDRADDIALPSTGTINYQLVGNTNPTDNLGNTGILGSASLSADFTSMTTTSSIDIGINSQVWSATGSGVIQTNGEFTGSMSVTGTDPTGTFSGTGSNAGFFTNNAEGAGMGYTLEATISGTPTNVTGTAAFQQ